MAPDPALGYGARDLPDLVYSLAMPHAHEMALPAKIAGIDRTNLAHLKAIAKMAAILAQDSKRRRNKGVATSVMQTMGQDYHHTCHSALYTGMPAVPRLEHDAHGGYCVICLRALPPM